MKQQKYYIGLDIGTDSVGYAVTDEQYNLCKFKGEPMWGVTLFDEAKLAAERRGFRSARRRLDRRQQRVQLLMDLFSEEIGKIDEGFFKRIKESYLYPENRDEKIRIFDTYELQKKYVSQYPTMHHLIVELMYNTERHDVRLVFLACAWLMAHRGHFLSEVNTENMEAVTDFETVYSQLKDCIVHDEYKLPWRDDIDLKEVQDALRCKTDIKKKEKRLSEALFGSSKAPKEINAQYEYNYEQAIKLLCGGKAELKALFGKEEYDDLEEKRVALDEDDEKLTAVMQCIGDDAQFLSALKSIFDWSVLVDTLQGEKTISEAKVAVYEQHREDLALLKRLVRKYIPQKYNEIFRDPSVNNNYVAYIGGNKTANEKDKPKKKTSKREFCEYIEKLMKSITPEAVDEKEYHKMMQRLSLKDFMPKQVNNDNRVIPYQLYWHELNKILTNAKEYISFLSATDEEGVTGTEKILSVFVFRVPYYVGPLKEKSNPKWNHWMIRKAEGKIYPWNFTDKVDLDKSEEAFIARMTNSCTYLPGEDVLPKNSLVYCAFEVLNEINNIKISGREITVEEKQGIYNDVFMRYERVTVKRIRDYLVSNQFMSKDEEISGIDITIKSSLRPFLKFRNLIKNGLLTYSDVESIIKRATYSEDKERFAKWLQQEYSNLPESEITYISKLKIKDFGRLSRKLLCGIEGANKDTGEKFTVIRAMWETNYNFMQLLSDKFTFSEQISKYVKGYYAQNPKSISEWLEEMYVSNSVKRPIIRSLDILKDIVKVQGCVPERIFIEMARGANKEQKNTRTATRLKQLQSLYKKIDREEIRKFNDQLEAWGTEAQNKLQSDRLFLYFTQLGKCLYTGKWIDIESLNSNSKIYDIEHIYPRSFVKDDSVINNKILVDSNANAEKGDTYPVSPDIQKKMGTYWKYLHDNGLMSDEKYRRLTRTMPFTDDERFEFVNRQLVETRQSTKALALLLKELYPNSEIVYVKAGLVSDFRQQFGLLKSRQVNDLHHAKDAYLNIVVGNVWYSKFSRRYWNPNNINNAKSEIVFTRPVVCEKKTVWNGVSDKERIVKVARKNTAHVTKYAFCRKGGLFDQMPVKASEKLVPLKKGLPPEKYGGYNKSTATFFVLVRYVSAKKKGVILMPVELLYAKQFVMDDDFALSYTKRTISSIINKPVVCVEFLLNKRIVKINTVLSLDGLRVCITGKQNEGKTIRLSCLTTFKTSEENADYIKHLESFKNKKNKISDIILSEKYDKITSSQNLDLYDHYVTKLQNVPYKFRPANPCGILKSGRDKFKVLSPADQVNVLLEIQGVFGRADKVNLSNIGGPGAAAAATLSSSLENWKKNYTDVRIIDSSASGLFETVSENLLDLL